MGECTRTISVSTISVCFYSNTYLIGLHYCTVVPYLQPDGVLLPPRKTRLRFVWRSSPVVVPVLPLMPPVCCSLYILNHRNEQFSQPNKF